MNIQKLLNFNFQCLLLIIFFCCLSANIFATTWHVRPSGDDTNSGTSWTQAFQTLQKAIDAASANDEIWVAAGTYLPTKESDGTTDSQRDFTFYLNFNIEIYGGFPNTGNPVMADRNWETNITTLSGDFNGDDGTNFANTGENAYTIVHTENVSTAFLMDGFFVEGGNANVNTGGGNPNRNGGGWFNSSLGSNNVSNPSIQFCRFQNNQANLNGGAMFNSGASGSGTSSPTLTNCSFQNNQASEGGALFNSNLFGTSSPILTNCRFQNNKASFNGGALYNDGFGGTSSPILTNCSFQNNEANFNGGALYNDAFMGTSSPTLTNCIFWQNIGNVKSMFNRSATPQINYSLLEESSCPGGATCDGNTIFNQDPLFTDPANGDLTLQPCSPVIDAGTATGAPTTDFEGDTRPTHSGVDMGIDEFTDALPTFVTCYVDADGDNFGDVTASSVQHCVSCQTGFVSNNSDCNDGDANIHPNATEICDGVDNNCDTQIDEGVLNTFYADTDNDNFGDPNNSTMACSAPTGFVADNTDCDDSNSNIHPNATEICDGVDNNCNSQIDEGVLNTFYADTDNDNFGDPNNSIMACSAPTGFVANNTDCDDSNSNIHPNATEICDGVDNNCDTQIDEGVGNLFHVNAMATGNNDGTTWANAFTNLQDALDVINNGCSIRKIWVAQGTYLPTKESDGTTDSQRDFTFYIDVDVEIYGGFPNTGNPVMADRDWETNITTLSGDFNNDDGPDFVNNDENAYTVVHTKNVSTAFLMDGFFVEGGNANVSTGDIGNPNRSGGGWYNDGSGSGNVSNPSIQFCRFQNNQANGDGGALYNRSFSGTSSPILTNCSFQNNQASRDGGALYNDGFGGTSSPTLTNCSFQNNEASRDGGALYNNGSSGTSSPILTNCNFQNNQANDDGGALYSNSLSGTSSPILTNCSFQNNQANDNGGALLNNSFGGISSPTLINCSFHNNQANNDGGALYSDGFGGISSPTLTNCSFHNNQANQDGGALYNNGSAGMSSPTLTNCIFWQNIGNGKSMFNRSATPQINYSLLEEDSCPTGATCDGNTIFNQDPLFTDPANGDLTLQPSSPAIDAGTATGAPLTDFEGDTRPTHNGFDMGIDEFTDALPNFVTCYVDADGDNFGDVAASSVQHFVSCQTGFVSNNSDCNDGDANIHPNATEICDGVDNNCNSQIDDGVLNTFYADTDNDNFGDPNNSTMACSVPAGFVSDNTDCDDSNSNIHPNATEICDGVDNNCDSQIDEGVLNTFYADTDNDNFGDPNNSTMACSVPAGFVADNTDCDDSNSNIHPNATEICDGVDNNCDSQIDEGVLNTFYADTDNDNFGDPNNSTMACSVPTGFVADNTDCDDSNSNIHPNATEICDGVDNNCDTQIDEGVGNLFHVNAMATGNNDGTTWANAFTNLQDALDAINNGCSIRKIWVAQGTYLPTKESGGTTNSQRDFTFYIDVDVEIYGGFPNTGNPVMADRDWETNITTLSGDFNNDDGANFANTDENAHTIVHTKNVSTAFLMDGFFVEGGNANVSTGGIRNPNRNGGGWYNDGSNSGNVSNPTIQFCKFQNNQASRFGGALYNRGDFGTSSPTLTNCSFQNNQADDGGALFNDGVSGTSSPILTNCSFQNNQADDGGALFNNGVSGTSSPILTNCNFQNNQANDGGGALYNDGFGGTSSPTLTNCSFQNNQANDDGGALYNDGVSGTSSPILTNCSFQNNQANQDGGALYNDGVSGTSSPTLTNCIFWQNIGNGKSMFNRSATPQINYSLLEEDSCPTGATCDGNTIFNQDPLFTDPANGDLTLQPCSPAIDAGTATGAPPTDFEGDTRPTHAGVDMGIDEFTAALPTFVTCYVDADGDNFGDVTASSVQHCVSCQTGFVSNNSDCNDGDANIHPNATEICDGVDNNCDSQIDEGLLSIFYADTDNDNFGDPNNSTMACSVPAGFVVDNTDCDDSNSNIHPNATEICDGVDNNCDTQIDEGVGNLFHVNAMATGNNDGTTWANAFTNLQDALDVINNGCSIRKIWVAQGTYLPTKESDGTTDSQRDFTFYIDVDVEIYGGFPNTGNPVMADRDWETNITTLSGDFNNNDGADFANTDENAYTVVHTKNVSTAFLMDGFFVEGGNANVSTGDIGNPNRSGGGWYNDGSGSGNVSNPSIQFCRFQNNQANGDGGALYNRSFSGTSSPILTNCSFQNNQASRDGGALYNDGFVGTSSPTLTNCSFQNNEASRDGGALYNNGSGGTSSPTLTNCSFQNNQANDDGGALFNSGFSGTSSPILTNCSFQNNQANDDGGTLFNNGFVGTSSPILTNCSFQNNQANQDGGAMFSDGRVGTSSPTLTNCIFWQNIGNSKSMFNRNATPQINYSLLEEDICPTGATCDGNTIFNQDPLFTDPANGDLTLQPCSPAIDAGTAMGAPFDDMGAFEFQGTSLALPVLSGLSSQVICVNDNFADVMVSSDVAVTYQWYNDNGADNANTDVLADQTGASLTALPTTVGVYKYRVEATRTASTGCKASEMVTLQIDALPVGGALEIGSMTSTTICQGSNAIITLSGHTGTIEKWQSSTDANFDNPIDINQTTVSYTTPNLTTTTYYRVVVKNGVCDAVNSAIATVNIDAPSQGGNVTPATNTICETGSVNLTLSDHTGTIEKWQSSTNVNFISPTDIVNTSTSYMVANISEKTYYRAVVKNGTCAPANSVAAVVNVSESTVGGMLSPAISNVSSGTNSTDLTLSGHKGAIQKWQSSTAANFSNPTDITHTGTTYTAVNLTQTTYYRAILKNGVCNLANSTTATINVDANSDGGTLNGSTMVCSGTNSTELTLTGSTGTIVRWESATNSVFNNPTDLENAGSLTYTAEDLVQTTYYRVIVQNGVSPEENSTTANISVDPLTLGGSIGGSSTVCAGTNNTQLALSGHTGVIQKWQSSTTTDFANPMDIANTITTLTVTNLSQTTYYRALVKSGTCPEQYSNTASITVTPISVGGTVAGGTTVSSGTNSTDLTLSGHRGTIEKWQSATDANFSSPMDIANTTTTLTATNLTVTTYYRAVVANGICPSINSGTAIIMVDGASMGGNIAGGTTVCSGTNSTDLTLSGHTGNVQKWQSATTATFTNPTDITNTTTTLTATNLTATTYYRAVVKNGVSDPVNSNTATISVNPVSVGGNVDGATTVCSGTNSTTLTLTGHTGLITKWQSSTTENFANPTDISHTAIMYTASNLSQSTYFRAVVQSGVCAIANANAALVTVTPVSVGGTIAGGTTVSGGTNSTDLTLSGHTGSIQKWQSATDAAFSSPMDITNTATTLTAENLIVTTYYRVVVANGICPSVNSGTAVIMVDGASAGGSIAGGATVCSGTNSTDLTLSGHTGNVQKWQSATTATFTNPTDITNTTTTLTATNLTATTYYRAVVKNGVSDPVNSNTATISVNPVSVGGNVDGATTVCSGTNSTTLTLTGHTGLITKWQSSTTENFANPTDINHTAIMYTVSNLSQSTYFRAVVQSGVCAVANANAALVTVTPVSVGGTIAGGTTVSGETNSTDLTLSGHTGSIQKWQSATDAAFSSPMDITNTATTLTAENLIVTTYYRVVVANGICPSVNSGTAVIMVDGASAGGSIAGGTTVCSDTNSTDLTLSGHTGTIEKWQLSMAADFANPMDIANTTTTLTATNLTVTTYYRAVVKNGVSAAVNSGTAAISVSPVSVGGSVGENATVCSGNNSATLNLSGQTGEVVNWQSSTTADFANPIAIVNTNTTYTATNLSQTTYYRAVVKSGVCSEAFSSAATVTVDPVSVGGTIAGAVTVCSGTNSSELTLSGYTGRIEKWQFSTEENFATPMDTAHTAAIYTAINLSATTYYRAVIQSGSCPIAFSGVARIEVDAPTTGGQLAGSTNVCKGVNNSLLSLSEEVGAILKWQRSTTANFSNPIDIAHTSNSFSVINLTETTYYRVVVKSGVCSTAFSEVATITVYADPTTANAGSDQRNICGAMTMLSANSPAVGVGKWTVSPGGGQFGNSQQANTTFQGNYGVNYTLTWTIAATCASSSDEVVIHFNADSDNDSKQDCIDLCPGGNDLQNTDGVGMPDACDCDLNNPNDEIVDLPGRFITQTDLDPGIYQAAYSLNSTARSNPNKTVIFKAGRHILLEPGFHAQAGTNFTARIEFCNFPSNNLVAEKEAALVNVLAEIFDQQKETQKVTTEPIPSPINTITTVPLTAIMFKVGPNPFRTKTTVYLELAEASKTNLSVFDANGRLLQVLLHQADMEAGAYQIFIQNEQLQGGVFYVHLQTDKESRVQKIIALR